MKKILTCKKCKCILVERQSRVKRMCVLCRQFFDKRIKKQ